MLRAAWTLGVVAMIGCGDDAPGGITPDAPPEHPPPRIIPGGGIGDGPIDGVANVYVIDDATRAPIAGATVRVGEVEGTTDDTGLFIAEGVTGPQTVAVKATSMRSELMVGANGTNITFNLQPSTPAVPPRATLSGQVVTTGITVAQGHTVLALVMYSQTDDLGKAENDIQTPNNANVCLTGVLNNQPCNYQIDTRTGNVALIAAIFDRDLNGTPTNPDDDTQTLIRWAARTGITVAAGVPQTGLDLTLIAVGDQQTVTVDFGTPPAGHPNQAALIGVELGNDTVFQLAPFFRTMQMATLLAPKPAALGGTGYRLTSLSSAGPDPSPGSVTLRRALPGPQLSSGTWLAPPTGVTISRTSATWTNVSGATLHSVEYDTDTSRLLGVTVLDGTTSVTIPDLLALPSGPLTAQLNAIGAPGLDVNNFSLDADRNKLAQVSSHPTTLP